MQIVIVGRGHSGTRAIAHTLRESGIYIGEVNASGDCVPGKSMYKAVKMAGDYVQFVYPYEWDFRQLIDMEPPDEYQQLVEDYLAPHFNGRTLFGWKLPESVLALPWLVKLFPNAYYIHWVRDGRDNILSYHDTEHLDRWNIPHVVPENSDRQYCAAVSWKYHEDLIAATPKPKRWHKVRLMDFVNHQDRELDRLNDFLGVNLETIEVFPEVVGRYKEHDLRVEVEIMHNQLKAHNFLGEE